MENLRRKLQSEIEKQKNTQTTKKGAITIRVTKETINLDDFLEEEGCCDEDPEDI